MEDNDFTKEHDPDSILLHTNISAKRIPAALLGIFLGIFSLNKLYIGYNKEALVQIMLNILTVGIATIVPLVEGIKYLLMTDKEFEATYIRGHKSWF